MKKYYFIIFLFCLILVVAIINNIYFKEGFTSDNNDLLNEYNLIKNGSFQNKTDISSNKKGINNIIKLDDNPNCNISQYVLEQDDSKDGSFYTIKQNVNKNFNYKLTIWLNSSKKCDLVFIKTSDNNVIKSTKNLVDKKVLNKLNWYKYEIIFSTENNDVINIELGTYRNINKRYFTNLILLPYLKNLPNFKTTIGLKTFLDAKNKESCLGGTSFIWNDLSNYNELYKWSKNPNWVKDGYFKTVNNTLSGPSGVKLLNTSNEFSIIIHSQSVASKKDSNKDNKQTLYLPNTNNTAIGINIPNNSGYIEITFNGKVISTKDKSIQSHINDNIYTLTYSNQKAKLWVNNQLFYTFDKVPQPLFDKNMLKINHNGNWDANLYSFLLYDKEISLNEIKYINNYLKNRPKIKPMINIIDSHNNSDSDNSTDDDNDGGDNYKKYKKRCHSHCYKKHKDIKNCRTEISACKKYCDDKRSSSDKICDRTSQDCPIVYKSNNEYIFYIHKNSKYTDKMGHGKRSYGTDKENANYLYKENFPDCPMPEALQFKRIDHNKCPFSVRKNNPCNEKECRSVDWSRDLHTQNIPHKCKRQVSHYCRKEVNNNLNNDSSYGRLMDPICECWKPSKINDEKCSKIRNIYEPANEYGYDINVFEIDEHPDFKNYIRKDKIPCWNCNLTAPDIKDSVANTRTWDNL